MLRIAAVLLGVALLGALAVVLFFFMRPKPAAVDPDAERPVGYPPSGKCLAHLARTGPARCPFGPPAVPVAGVDWGEAFEEGKAHCVLAGTIDLPTGAVVAADPYVNLQLTALDTHLPPGLGEVVLSRTGTDAQAETAFAMVHVGTARPVRWEAGDKTAYPVDSGTGCFGDGATVARILAREERRSDLAAKAATRRVSPDDAEAWHAAMREELARTPDLYDLASAQEHDAGPFRGWTSLCIDPTSGANIVVFHSGAGDGVYPTYTGRDAGGRVVALVTDFHLSDLGDKHPPRHGGARQGK